MTHPRILFICKNRQAPYSADDSSYSTTMSSGLHNSVNFVVKMLLSKGIDAKIVDVVDNNCIDREVKAFNPTHVIVEALWVVPSKFDILTKLYPAVQWVVRLHSELPFIACEGIAMEWVFDSDKHTNVTIATNSKRLKHDLASLLTKPVLYLPNYYDVSSLDADKSIKIEKCKSTIDVGCFGAIRQLKNQLIQAVAAIHFADKIGKTLRFHINGNRIEGKADPVLKNIRKLFEKNTEGHVLVEHDWMSHSAFTGLIAQMDMVMQVSFSETYNIVTADAVAQHVPVVTSSEIKFINSMFQVNCTNLDDIVSTLYRTYMLSKFKVHYVNFMLLSANSKAAAKQWVATFK